MSQSFSSSVVARQSLPRLFGVTRVGRRLLLRRARLAHRDPADAQEQKRRAGYGSHQASPDHPRREEGRARNPEQPPPQEPSVPALRRAPRERPRDEADPKAQAEHALFEHDARVLVLHEKQRRAPPPPQGGWGARPPPAPPPAPPGLARPFGGAVVDAPGHALADEVNVL